MLLGKLSTKNHDLRERIINVLCLLANDPFTSSLKTHKLTGSLESLWSGSVAYDCRIIFTFSEEEDLEEYFIVLLNIGSHDEVY